jgi:hypothetical protein
VDSVCVVCIVSVSGLWFGVLAHCPRKHPCAQYKQGDPDVQSTARRRNLYKKKKGSLRAVSTRRSRCAARLRTLSGRRRSSESCFDLRDLLEEKKQKRRRKNLLSGCRGSSAVIWISGSCLGCWL